MEVEGDVTQHMDRIIGKQVFKVRGTVSAGNYARLPPSRAHDLGLTGRFLYIQVRGRCIRHVPGNACIFSCFLPTMLDDPHLLAHELVTLLP